MAYYLSLEIIWILSNISVGPKQIVEELVFNNPEPDYIRTFHQESTIISFIKYMIQNGDLK